MTVARRPSSAQSTGSDTSKALSEVAPTPSRTNLDALSTFIASRRPTFIWVSSNGEALPGRTVAARQRTASAPYLSRISVGTPTLALDFDILLLSGSRMQPDSIAWVQGVAWFS